ncbi:MAG TPA: hypothetical protein VNY36_01970 [Bacteroidia bacterium]|jgi:hypothetical protein|nr:hypothetical protein [Bacteroidia bacterium]
MRKGIACLIVVSAFFLYKPVMAQVDVRDSVASGVLCEASYAAQLPGGDLAKEFGWNSNVQVGAYYKTKDNWIFGVQGAFIFGDVLRATGIFDSIATKDRNLIANDGSYPGISYFERGYNIQLSAGKLFTFKKPNPNSGILVTVNVGYIRHHIRIQAPGTPQVDSLYQQGYDRLTAGICFTEFVGYQYLGNHRMVNFFAGFEFTQAFTKGLRYDFDLMHMDSQNKHDLLSGFRIGWILPIYRQESTKFYTY